MKPLGHGANVAEIASLYNKDLNAIVDFSSNINPKVPSGLEEVLKEAYKRLVAYPDIYYTDLKVAIGKYIGVKPEEIIVGNGATEIMYLLMKALKSLNGKICKLGIIHPTFSEYERSGMLSGMEIVDFFFKENEEMFQVDMNEINLDEVDALFICNPNNPTGSVERLEGLLENIYKKQKLLIVDETFMEFLKEEEVYSLISKIKDYKNLIIIKAVTKFFGLPGLRLGYGVTSNEALLEEMYKYKEPWSVNGFAEHLTPIMLEDEKYIEDTKKYFEEESKRMLEALRSIKKMKVYKTYTNFILLKLETIKAADLKERLIKKYDLLIRDASNFKGLNEYFIRVAVKKKEENDQLIRALRRELEDELY